MTREEDFRMFVLFSFDKLLRLIESMELVPIQKAMLLEFARSLRLASEADWQLREYQNQRDLDNPIDMVAVATID